MLRLVPLAETISGQELLKDGHVSILTRLVRRKLGISEESAETVSMELQKLDIERLEQLANDIFDIGSFKQFKNWIAKQLPKNN